MEDNEDEEDVPAEVPQEPVPEPPEVEVPQEEEKAEPPQVEPEKQQEKPKIPNKLRKEKCPGCHAEMSANHLKHKHKCKAEASSPDASNEPKKPKAKPKPKPKEIVDPAEELRQHYLDIQAVAMEKKRARFARYFL